MKVTKVFISIPSFALHGGIRIIMEWANRLAALPDVKVTLYSLKGNTCTWFAISPDVTVTNNEADIAGHDCLIITSPHAIHLQHHPNRPDKVFLFMQMVESMFRPNDTKWQEQCRQFYLSPHPLISISQWNMQLLHAMNRKGDMYYVGNGVNFEHFPLNPVDKDFNTVLVEGWDTTNPSKDPERIAQKVAARLRKEGYRIIVYSSTPRLPQYKDVPHEFHYQPTYALMNSLYSRATLLLKATKVDARSCSPVEAMTKGTVTARAIILGDDDLEDYGNSLRCGYNEKQLYDNAKLLLTQPALHKRLAEAAVQHVQANSWDNWIPKIYEILCR